jgi:hypothetical protein
MPRYAGVGGRGSLAPLFNRAFTVREIAGLKRPVYCFGKVLYEPGPGFSVPPLHRCFMLWKMWRKKGRLLLLCRCVCFAGV